MARKPAARDFVTDAYAQNNRLRSITDLRRVAGTMTIAGPPQFATSPPGLPELSAAYGVTPQLFRGLPVGAEYTPLNDGTVQAGPRYASVYQIHKTRCIFCGYCEEACPVGAIFMGKDYELAVYSKDDFVWDKADLLVPATVGAPALAQQAR